jgi:hypothetical protein
MVVQIFKELAWNGTATLAESLAQFQTFEPNALASDGLSTDGQTRSKKCPSKTPSRA